MDCLISDSASNETSRRVKEILRALLIDDWQSEPHYQHQNPAERRWRFLKRNLAYIMNLRNVDPNCWFLCMQWCADVMNHTAERSLNWRPPLEVLTGRTVDISILLIFMFWDVVYIERYPQMRADKKDEVKTAKKPRAVGSKFADELRGRFVGFAWNCGNALTFKILLDNSKVVVNRSIVRLANVTENNLRADVAAGATPTREYIRSRDAHRRTLPTIDVSKSPFVVGDTVLGAFKLADDEPVDPLVVPPPPTAESLSSALPQRIAAKAADAGHAKARHDLVSPASRESSQIGEPTGSPSVSSEGETVIGESSNEPQG